MYCNPTSPRYNVMTKLDEKNSSEKGPSIDGIKRIQILHVVGAEMIKFSSVSLCDLEK